MHEQALVSVPQLLCKIIVWCVVRDLGDVRLDWKAKTYLGTQHELWQKNLYNDIFIKVAIIAALIFLLWNKKSENTNLVINDISWSLNVLMNRSPAIWAESFQCCFSLDQLGLNDPETACLLLLSKAYFTRKIMNGTSGLLSTLNQHDLCNLLLCAVNLHPSRLLYKWWDVECGASLNLFPCHYKSLNHMSAHIMWVITILFMWSRFVL